MYKPSLLLISDLLGDAKSEYLLFYNSLLKSHYDIVIIDACELAGIHNSHQDANQNHSAFIDGEGLLKSVQNLQRSYKNPDYIIGFSIGGTIAWQACRQNLSVKNLICISSTRLRYETKKPNCKIDLYFGEKDKYRPSKNWELSDIQNPIVIPDAKHEVYKEKKFINEFCKNLIQAKLN